jgi:hypothetical protein
MCRLCRDSALAAEPSATSDFFLVAGLSAKTTIREAQSLYGLGFISGKRTAVSFTTSGKDGGTYRVRLTLKTEIQFDCGWLEARHEGSTQYAVRGAERGRSAPALSHGKDRNAYLSLIGAKLKGYRSTSAALW